MGMAAAARYTSLSPVKRDSGRRQSYIDSEPRDTTPQGLGQASPLTTTVVSMARPQAEVTASKEPYSNCPRLQVRVECGLKPSLSVLLGCKEWPRLLLRFLTSRAGCTGRRKLAVFTMRERPIG